MTFVFEYTRLNIKYTNATIQYQNNKRERVYRREGLLGEDCLYEGNKGAFILVKAEVSVVD